MESNKSENQGYCPNKHILNTEKNRLLLHKIN